MDPIKNSPVKERMRQANETQAKNQESQIRSRLNSQLNAEVPKEKYHGTPFVVGGIVLGIVCVMCELGLDWIIWGLLLGLIAWACSGLYVSSSNKSLEWRKQEMSERAEAEIRQAYADADARTARETNDYDTKAREYAKKVLQQGSKLDPMVERVTSMFQRMISHADAGAHMKFVEADFTYTVRKDGISFSYQSRYSNLQDDYSFNRERLRDLNSEAECEGLARARSKMTTKRMKGLYPPKKTRLTFRSRIQMHLLRCTSRERMRTLCLFGTSFNRLSLQESLYAVREL